MITTILCTDGSDIATKAAKVGASVLRPADKEVVVCVVEPPDPSLVHGASGFAGGTMSDLEFDEAVKSAIEEGHEIVGNLVSALGAQSAEARVLTGDPRAVLCDLAAELSATTLVVGSRGRGGLKRALLGSVSDYLVRNAPCPVLVVRG